jgi:hypothetical protein
MHATLPGPTAAHHCNRLHLRTDQLVAGCQGVVVHLDVAVGAQEGLVVLAEHHGRLGAAQLADPDPDVTGCQRVRVVH